jgi:SAM-dependent methyltransferase
MPVGQGTVSRSRDPFGTLFMLSDLKARFCVGKGLEIGPGKNPQCDRANTVYLDCFVDNKDATPSADLIADAARIPIEDNSFDFVMSSHMLEHHQDTLRVLHEWKRLLKPGGVLFLILPHHARTFDRYRAVTTLQHHIDDYATLGDTVDQSHYEEIRAGWSKIEDFEEQRVAYEAEWRMDVWDWPGRVRNGVIHYHVWSQNEIVDLLRYIGVSVEFVADFFPERPDSFLVIGRR